MNDYNNTDFNINLDIPDVPELNSDYLKVPWYLSIYFISFLLFLFKFINIIIIIPIILLIIRYKKEIKLFEQINNYHYYLKKSFDTTKQYCQKVIDDTTSKLNVLNTRISLKNSEYNNLSNKYYKLDAELSNTYRKRNDELEDNYQLRKQKLFTELTQKENDISELNSQILKSENISFSMDSTPYKFNDEITSQEYKDRIAIVNINYNKLIDSDCKGIKVTLKDLDKKILSNNKKQLLRCYNAECNNIISNVTVKNIDTSRKQLLKSYETLNRIYKTSGVELSDKMVKNKLEELNYTYSFKLQKDLEKEEQRAIKEQMIEEEKLRREIEKEKARIDKEINHFNNEINSLMGYVSKTNDEIKIEFYLSKIKELEEKLVLLQKDKENVLEREQNTRAGFVYIISNIGSFGENIYKIGMTRRLEPMDRIKELSGASVPFEFDVHAMIFSEDAPKLENILHQTFKENAVNKVNSRKEFFKVSLFDIEKIVKGNHNATVQFTRFAKAEQYRDSLKIESEFHIN